MIRWSSDLMAIAWSKQFDFVASTIVGARNASQLDESLAAIDLELSEETMKEIKNIQNEIMYPMG